ncbi:hypothetical protein [Pyxidicoccus xibeiensis]|uniref:hypothetical protein n=1 Tax=Pyxidicoccus xibeiensis TaxID=2906759 RepID=UPI0020A76C7F|nr:hypothetical protein [Pyxidicoccus xibeiensis]MCP3143878.1 hypothetical protein [Pyxidicoccus xibeiensis]
MGITHPDGSPAPDGCPSTSRFARLSADVRVNKLRELLEVVWDERALPAGMEYSSNEIIVSLRGGSVGYGTAPLELALSKSAEIRSLLYRTAEWVRREPLRRGGLPKKEILSAVQARATQAVAGSYRFSIRLVEPAQMELFDKSEIEVENVADALFDVVRKVSDSSPNAAQELRTFVPDDGYRQALIKLVRNIVPSDKSLGEVELTRVHKSGTNDDPERESLLLHSGVRETISHVLRQELDANVNEQSDETEVRGTLRALHLDQKWLAVVKDDGAEQRCVTHQDVLDDVVGPMVNRRVVVRGRWTGVARRKFLLSDIDLDARS